ncbi:MAG: BCCT family transporter [Reichenbachiella sp.]
MKTVKTDKDIFYGSLLLLIVFTAPLIVFPLQSRIQLENIKLIIEDNIGSLYQLLALTVFIFSIWLAFGKHGKTRLGENNYNFSTYSWASMLFCAGVATGILYWGTIEWSYYLLNPPFGLDRNDPLTIEYASTYGMFHWGLVGWSFYCIPAVAISYAYYIKKYPVLRLSRGCQAVLGEKMMRGRTGKIIDILFMVGLLGSTGTSMGLGTPMITAGIEHLTGIPDSFGMKITVITICAVIFSVSVYLGLGRGIKKLSNTNTIIAFFFLSFVFIVGPSAFMLKMSVNSFGLMTQNFIRMLTWTDPLSDSRFVEDWSIFYWAWWVAVGPFMGIFITKISGGRTIRQMVLGTMLFGSLGCTIFYGVLGNYALDLHLNGKLNILEMVENSSPAKAIAHIIASLPFGNMMLFMFCTMSVIFMATSFDSTSYTLASCASEKLEAHKDPERWQRLFWAFALIILPLTLMFVGGLEALKIAVLISALPLIIVYIIMCWSLIKIFK